MSAGLCLIAMSAANVVCIRHMWRARKLQWSRRRFRLVAIHYAMLNIQVRALDASDCPYQVLHILRQRVCLLLRSNHVVARCTSHELLTGGQFNMTAILHSQMLNATFWLAPNARLLQTQCAWCDMHTVSRRGLQL